MHQCRQYAAHSGRGTGNERVLTVLLTSANDIRSDDDNPVVGGLLEEGLAESIGVYFYRFAHHGPFIKIGETTRLDGILKRFRNGWFATPNLSESYKTKPQFVAAIDSISPENPAYFVFYEHHLTRSNPKIDELIAHVMHQRLFCRGTINPEKINRNRMLGRGLVWHAKAFAEVARLRFPDGTPYPV